MREQARSAAGEEHRLDVLLHAAARYVPDRPAPAGIAGRALAGKLPQCRVRIRVALVLSAASALLVGYAGLRYSPTQTTAAHLPREIARGERQHAPTQPPAGVRRAESGASRGVERPAAQPPGARSRSGSPARRHSRSVTPRPPRVRLRERLVRRYASGIVAPVWVAQDDGDGEDLTVAPALATVRLHEETAPPAGPASASDYVVLALLEGDR